MNAQPPTQSARIQHTTGMAYLGVLLMVLLLTLTGLTFIATVRISSMATAGRLDAIQADYLAESAANHALWRLLNEESLEYHIAQDRDDSEQDGDVSVPYGATLELGQRYYVGLRFLKVAIPQGETVNAARVLFTASIDDNGPTWLTIYGEDSNSAGAFDDDDSDLSGRSRTDEDVPWSVPQWQRDTAYETPDLSPIIQEIVDRPGWSAGNDIVLLFRTSWWGGRRRAYARDSGMTPAMLSVSYGDQHPTSPTNYTMHALAGGRYGYKIRRPSPITFGTVATVGAKGKSVAQQSYVADILARETPAFVTLDKISKTGEADKSLATWSHTIGDGTNRLLVVCGSVHDTQTLTNLTYGGISLVQHGTTSGGERHVTMWYLVDPPVGTHDVSATFNMSTHFRLAAVSFFGVDPSTPVDSLVANTGTGTQVSLSVASSVGCLALGTIAGTKLSGPVAPASGQTDLWSDAGGDEAWGAGSTEAGSATVNMGWTLDASCGWAAAGVNINPAR